MTGVGGAGRRLDVMSIRSGQLCVAYLAGGHGGGGYLTFVGNAYKISQRLSLRVTKNIKVPVKNYY